MSQPPMENEELRQLAVTRLRKKRELKAHVLAYVMVNTLLVTVWAMTDFGGFFWPAFPILGWGIGLAFHIWDVVSPAPTEQQIREEMSRLQSR